MCERQDDGSRGLVWLVDGHEEPFVPVRSHPWAAARSGRRSGTGGGGSPGGPGDDGGREDDDRGRRGGDAPFDGLAWV